MARDPKASCPKCGKRVDRVDGEYARHAAKGEFCTMSKREIVEKERRE